MPTIFNVNYSYLVQTNDNNLNFGRVCISITVLETQVHICRRNMYECQENAKLFIHFKMNYCCGLINFFKNKGTYDMT